MGVRFNRGCSEALLDGFGTSVISTGVRDLLVWVQTLGIGLDWRS